MSRRYEEIGKCPRCRTRLIFDNLPQELYCLACGFRTTGRKQVCRVCGHDFIARIGQLSQPVVCCSKSCALRWQYELQRQHDGPYRLSLKQRGKGTKLPLKECAWCGVSFWPRLSVQVFCSVKCAVSERMSQVKKQTPWVSRVCPICGNEFKVKRSQVDAGHGLLCSLRCRGIKGARAVNQKKKSYAVL